MTKVLLNCEGNLGYGPDQIHSGTTLACLLEAVEEAIAEWGEDAEVVLHQTNNGRGANFGKLAKWTLFDAADPEDEEDIDLAMADGPIYGGAV